MTSQRIDPTGPWWRAVVQHWKNGMDTPAYGFRCRLLMCAMHGATVRKLHEMSKARRAEGKPT